MYSGGLFAAFSKQILAFFGANAELLPNVREYSDLIVRFFPFFVFPTFLGAFIRNDGAPALTMIAVVSGGVVNVFFDWFLVFPMGMGMRGAAIATVIGTAIQTAIMCGRFFSKKCGLRLVKPRAFFKKAKKIAAIGTGASILDLGTVVIVIIMNNRIIKYGGNSELAVYGVLAATTSLFQALYCGVGQAIQPLVSANFGANQTGRIKEIRKLSLITTVILGVIFTAIGELFPVQTVKLFVNATPAVIGVAPPILRAYSLIFIPLGSNVLSAYYLQSVMRDKASAVIAALRSVALSGVCAFVLPLIFGLGGIWAALPVSETLTAIIAVSAVFFF